MSSLAWSGELDIPKFVSYRTALWRILFIEWNLARIDLKVGQEQTYQITYDGKQGSLRKQVARIESSNRVWIRETYTFSNSTEIAEYLVEKSTGRILDFLIGGQRQSLPDFKIRITRSKSATAIDPLSTDQMKEIEIRANGNNGEVFFAHVSPRKIPIDGLTRLDIPERITFELVDYLF
ncbi:MAG: hypothetical protein AB7F43_03250 [Bacteriovoracia bacterium]